MITGGSNSCFPNSGPQNLPSFTTSHNEDVASTPYSTSFLYNLSVLKDKVHQVESLASVYVSPGSGSGSGSGSGPVKDQHSESMAIAITNMGTLIQEIIVTSSTMMFSCRQMALGFGPNPSPVNHIHPLGIKDHNNIVEVTQFVHQEQDEKGSYSNLDLDWFGDDHTSYEYSQNPNFDHNINPQRNIESTKDIHHQKGEAGQRFSPRNYDIIEMEVADLLARYTHYCQVCGKGFKRDANMRMHMRAHGDKYKSREALSSKNTIINNGESSTLRTRKYSCPVEGCRWNKKNEKFQPLKSMICMKNHYKRSHCPKMYVCRRCNMKNFSVLSDLRTHEKHCGDVRWQCSCGNTFSRKDKLMGHVNLFVGHSPDTNSLARMGKRDTRN